MVSKGSTPRCCLLTLVHDHEVGVTVLVNLANASEQESDTGVLRKAKKSVIHGPEHEISSSYLIPDHGQQFALNSRVESHA